MQLIRYQDKLLLVKRTIIESKVKPDFDNQTMKEWTSSDIILRKDGLLFMCEEIAEAVIESESSENFFEE
jgi:hypothetical protein